MTKWRLSYDHGIGIYVHYVNGNVGIVSQFWIQNSPKHNAQKWLSHNFYFKQQVGIEKSSLAFSLLWLLTMASAEPKSIPSETLNYTSLENFVVTFSKYSSTSWSL